MIYLVVDAHMPWVVRNVDDPTVLTFVGTFVTDGLIRLAILIISCISGFLIFYKAMDLNFLLLLRKRFNALVLPLLIWNMPVVLHTMSFNLRD